VSTHSQKTSQSLKLIHPARDGTVSARAGDAPALAGGFLGTKAKFQATLCHKAFQPSGTENIDPQTGEVFAFSPSGFPLRDAAHCRLERYQLQSVVRSLLPHSRTAKCLRIRQSKSNSIGVFRSTEYKRAHYGGLQTCASVWACPVCSAKISERRRAELQTLIAAHEAAGGVVLLVTRTVPHSRRDDLDDLLNRIGKAEASHKSHRDYKTLMQSVGLVGTVRAVEVTHGQANGWHPHVHELVFLASVVHLPDLEEDLSRIWKGAALRAGLDLPSRAHGLTVQDGSKAAKYASKWGLESELTQWHRKRGKIESKTPFDLLRDVIGNDDAWSAALFIAYTEAFHGRHQLQFSRGLKHRYQIAEVSDEALTLQQDADAVLLGNLDLEQWKLVCKMNQRGALLEVAAMWGWDGVLQLLAGLDRALRRQNE